MNISALIHQLLSTENPVLPEPTLMLIALHVGWASVLGASAFWAGGRLRPVYRLGLSLLVALWGLWPGSASPTYWLGLAFQAPSLMTVLLCWLGLSSLSWRKPAQRISGSGEQTLTLKIGMALGIALGWVLLLDTLAWWPVSVYSWGFSAATCAVVAGLAVIFWAFGAGFTPWNTRHNFNFFLVLGVVALFVLTRLPTGNVWDALLDPWLWLALQALAIRVGWQRWRGQRAG